MLTPGWSHITDKTQSAIVVLDSGDSVGQASFARDATSAFEERVVLADNREDLLTHHRDHDLLRAWNHGPSSPELMPAVAMLESAGGTAS